MLTFWYCTSGLGVIRVWLSFCCASQVIVPELGLAIFSSSTSSLEVTIVDGIGSRTCLVISASVICNAMVMILEIISLYLSGLKVILPQCSLFKICLLLNFTSVDFQWPVYSWWHIALFLFRFQKRGISFECLAKLILLVHFHQIHNISSFGRCSYVP